MPSLTGRPIIPKSGPKPVKRRKPLKQQSAKRKAVAPKRAAFVKRELAARPHCEVCPVLAWYNVWPRVRCVGESQCIHEPLKQSQGGSRTSRANSYAACMASNAWVEQHPAIAKTLGLCIESHGLVEPLAFNLTHEHWKRIGVEHAIFSDWSKGEKVLTSAGMFIRTDAHSYAAHEMSTLMDGPA